MIKLPTIYAKLQTSFPLTKIILVLLFLFMLNGCFGPIIGLIADALPKKKVPAQLDMSDRRVLVWVDDLAVEDPDPILRRELTLKIQDTLLANKAVGGLIAYEKISSFRIYQNDLVSLSIQQLGGKLKADMVLYVLVDKFSLQRDVGDDNSLSGYCKVVDVTSGNRIWPTDENRKLFSVTGKFNNLDSSNLESNRKSLRQLCDLVVAAVCPYFFEHRAN